MDMVKMVMLVVVMLILAVVCRVWTGLQQASASARLG